jgi:plastocyanin
MDHRFATALAALSLALAGAFASCGDDDGAPASATKDTAAPASAEIAATDFAFQPASLRGAAGQKLKLTIVNSGKAKHNFTIASASLDRDIEPGARLEVEVTFPASGGLAFQCKYHAARGMAGELLAGDAKPQPATGAKPAGSATASPGSAADYTY